MPIHAEVHPDSPELIRLDAPFAQNHLIKECGGKYKEIGGVKCWTIPLSWVSCVQLRGTVGADLTIGPNLREWASQELARRVGPAMALRDAEEADPLTEGLRQYQCAGARFLVAGGQVLLTDQPGLGKTVQVAAALQHLSESGQNPFPVLVVCPKSVSHVAWAKDLAAWCPAAKSVVVPKPGTANLQKALDSCPDVVVVNYENTWRNSRLAGYGSLKLTEKQKTPGLLNFTDWQTVVLDEAHRIKNPKSLQTRAVWAIAKHTRWRWALTGTPIANDAGDLWALLHFLDPAEWSSKTAYRTRYCLTQYNPHSGFDDIVGLQRGERRDELNKVLHPRLRRMTKDRVLSQLPPKIRQVRETPMGLEQAKAYRSMEDSMLLDIGGTDRSALFETNALHQRMRMLQFSSSYAQFVPDPVIGDTLPVGRSGMVRLSDPSNKIDELVQLLEDLGDEQVVVFAQSRQLIELAEKRLAGLAEPVNTVKVVGGVSAANRQEAVRSFQAGEVRVFLGTTQAAGEGITLSRSRVVVFLQRTDSMVGNLQAEDRVHRIGSEIHESVLVIDMVTPGTIEELQIEQLHTKLLALKEVVGDA